jgi:tetratricopeptide (TPR) repeat protein/tRNA A-37 threonylcarbamoyl transferase component Bud32
MAEVDVDRNLLFGVIALQDDLIDETRFADVCAGWAVRMQVPLADLLVERGWLTAEERREVERKLERKVRKHKGDVRASLGAVAGGDVRDALRAVEHPAVRNSLRDLPPAAGYVLVETVVRPSEGQRSRYSLTRLHAEGGLGKVWVARDGDLNREVALKEIRTEQAANPEAWRRFLKEAQITGQLEHPNIVPVYELTRRPEDDQPFYTMRLVRGQTLRAAIADHHRRRGRGPADPLELQKLLGAFVHVCQAIGYAHSRGVIHRDLKPDNVVLGGFGEVIVLDWGLARMVDRPDDDAPEVNLSAEATTRETVGTVGTPAYMAPEQAEGRHDLVDTRTDVYGLGAILFETLTGRPPVDGETTAEVLQRVASGSIPGARAVEPTVPRALDAVCSRAMARSRSDRYATALALAEDVQRWTAGEPVSAWREPWTVRARRWTARHRPLVAGAAALLATTAVALAVGAVLLSRANARIAASAAKAEAINDFLINEMLAQAAPENNVRAREMTVVELLDRSAAKVGAAFGHQPEVEAAIREAIGQAYLSLGEYGKGEPHLRRALDLRRRVLGADHGDTLKTTNDLALLLHDSGRLTDAGRLFGDLLATYRRVLGPEHPDTLTSMNNLGLLFRDLGRRADAERLFREALAVRLRTQGADHPDTLVVMGNLALLLDDLGRLPDAEAFNRRVLEISRRVRGADHPKTLTSMNNLAHLYQRLGRLEDAERLNREALEIRRRVLGFDHPDTLFSMSNLAAVLRELGRTGEAEKLGRDTLEARRRVLGADHPDTLTSMNDLGLIYQKLGRTDEAERLLRQTLEAVRRVRGVEHPEALSVASNLAYLLYQLGRPSEAESLYRQAFEVRRRTRGADHPDTLESMGNLAVSLQDLGRADESRRLLADLVPALRRTLPGGHPAIADALSPLGWLLTESGKAREAEPLLREALEVRRKAHPGGHWIIAQTESLLGDCLAKQGRYGDAEQLLVGGYTALAAAPGVPPMRRAQALERIIAMYEARGMPARVAEWRAKRGAGGPAALH